MWSLFTLFTKKKPAQPASRAGMHGLIDDFLDSIGDIHTPDQLRVSAAVLSSRTPIDLWYLRDKLFNLIAHRHSEGEARRRVQRLNHRLKDFIDGAHGFRPCELPPISARAFQ